MPDTDIDQEQELNLGQLIARARRIALRGRWWIFGAASVIALGTIAVLSYIPNRYKSEATLLIVQQQIPERYVVPTTTTDIDHALGAMAEDVLSRTRLLAIIDDLHLYPREKQDMAPEKLIDLMRNEITMEPVKKTVGPGIDGFKISFTAKAPNVAQSVTHRLTELFIEQNLKTRADQAQTTTGFLREQVEAAKQKLLDHEQKLRNFKMEHLGELPEQQQGNMSILSGLQAQLENVAANMNRANQQRLYLQSLLEQYRRMSKRGESLSPHAPTPLEAARRDLTRLQAEQQQLLAQYTARHPDVVKNGQEIARQKALVELLAAAEVPADQNSPPHVDSNVDPETATAVAQLNSQLQANRLELESLSKSEAKLKGEIETYQSRLNQTPVREQQLTAMLRDYDMLKKNYADLLNKELDSQLSTNLEKRQEGQQFRLIDPANLPEVPSSPKRVKISLIGIAAGLVLGIALAWFGDSRKSCCHSEEDLTRYFEFPLLIGMPLVRTPAEQSSQRRKQALEWVTATMLLCAVGIAEFFVFRRS